MKNRTARTRHEMIVNRVHDHTSKTNRTIKEKESAPDDEGTGEVTR
jgi:hypothetical protein